MSTEVVVFLAVVLAVVVLLLWRSRRTESSDPALDARAIADRPEPSISNESGIGPHRDMGRPFRVDPGDRPTDGGDTDA